MSSEHGVRRGMGCGGSASSQRLSRRRLLRRSGLAVGALSVGSVLQGCGGDDAPAGGRELVVEMNDEMRFVPAALTIRTGQTVVWRNVGTMVHTATCDPSKAQEPEHARLPAGATPWDSDLIRAGQSWSHTFTTAGVYSYFCIPHEAGGMVASLTVEEEG